MDSKPAMTGFTGRIRSFKFAFRGLATMLRSQRNAWIHAAATVVVCAVSASLGLRGEEWCWIILAVTGVWTAEALNTALEFLTDVASPQFHPLAAKAKDVAAGGVLVTAMGAVLIGLIVLGPHLLDFLRPWMEG